MNSEILIMMTKKENTRSMSLVAMAMLTGLGVCKEAPSRAGKAVDETWLQQAKAPMFTGDRSSGR